MDPHVLADINIVSGF